MRHNECCRGALIRQRGLKPRIILHEMKELRVLQARLLEEKRCREVLAALKKKSPVDFYEEFRAGLEHARRLEFDPAKEQLVADIQRLFDSVKDRIEVC